MLYVASLLFITSITMFLKTNGANDWKDVDKSINSSEKNNSNFILLLELKTSLNVNFI